MTGGVNLEIERLVNRVNILPIGGMAVWMTSMLQFWGAASGPMKPFYYPQVDTAPGWFSFAIWTAASFVPYLFRPAGYFRTRSFERNRCLYERLGVRVFKRFASNGDYINRWVRQRYPSYRIVGRQQSIEAFLKQSIQGERWHLVLFLLGTFTQIYALRIGWYVWFLVLCAGNVVFNLYPILLQRYNRARVLALPRLMQNRQA